MVIKKPTHRLPAPPKPLVVREKSFPWLASGQAKILNRGCRIKVFMPEMNDDRRDRTRYRQFKCALIERGIEVLDHPRHLPLSTISYLYIYTTETLDDSLPMLPGFNYEAWPGLITLIKEGEAQASAFIKMKLKTPPCGVPLSHPDLEYMLSVLPALQSAYNKITKEWGGKSVPLPLTSHNNLRLPSHRTLHVPIAPPSDISMPTVVRSTPAPSNVSIDTEAPVDARTTRLILRLGRAELRKRHWDAEHPVEADACGECSGTGQVARVAAPVGANRFDRPVARGTRAASV